MGVADEVVPSGGDAYYYEEAAQRMGGAAELQKFFRFYPLPGIGHVYTPGNVSGTAGVSPPADPPFNIDGKPLVIRGKMFQYLVDWVEKGQAPGEITLTNKGGTASRPLCLYPVKLKYMGGDAAIASSYQCTVR